jgi:hypothetical protein
MRKAARPTPTRPFPLGNWLVKKAAEYHTRADECRALAARAANPEHKAMLHSMAETWENLARQRENFLARRRESLLWSVQQPCSRKFRQVIGSRVSGAPSHSFHGSPLAKFDDGGFGDLVLASLASKGTTPDFSRDHSRNCTYVGGLSRRAPPRTQIGQGRFGMAPLRRPSALWRGSGTEGRLCRYPGATQARFIPRPSKLP